MKNYHDFIFSFFIASTRRRKREEEKLKNQISITSFCVVVVVVLKTTCVTFLGPINTDDKQYIYIDLIMFEIHINK